MLKALSLGFAWALVANVSLAAAPDATPSPSKAGDDVDAVRLVYWAPEFGGPSKPHVLSRREIAFWADVEARGQEGQSNESIAARYMSVATERLVLEDLWSTHEAREEADPPDFNALSAGLMAELVRRSGGNEAFEDLERRHGIGRAEVFLRMRERARALRHAEAHHTRVRSVSESDLRVAWDTLEHPFRGQDYSEARDAFSVWHRVEVLRALELDQMRASRKLVRLREVL